MMDAVQTPQERYGMKRRMLKINCKIKHKKVTMAATQGEIDTQRNSPISFSVANSAVV